MRALAGFLALTLAGIAQAEDATLEGVREARSAARAKELPTWLTGNPHGEAMRALAAETVQSTEPPIVRAPQREAAPAAGSDRQVLVFVSFALGDGQLHTLYETVAGDPRVTVVFRGVREGEGLKDFIRRVHDGLQGLDPPPNIAIDPTKFTELAVTVAPEIVIVRDGRVEARVRGLADPAWLLAETDAGRGGDRGLQGPTVPVEEPDLIAEMQRRMAALDLEAMRREAVSRYWSRVRFTALPEAEEDREREVDMGIVATRDILGANGELIVAAGTRLNPLDHLPFTARLVVFDATRPEQVAAARRMASEAGARRVRLITTRLDPEAGWEGLRNLENTLDAPVYLLTPEIRERFALERVPAFVESRAGRMVVSEVKP